VDRADYSHQTLNHSLVTLHECLDKTKSGGDFYVGCALTLDQANQSCSLPSSRRP
jgi:hypothetical protein